MLNSDLETPIRSSEIYESSSHASEGKANKNRLPLGVTVRKANIQNINMKGEPKLYSQIRSKLLPSIRGSFSGGIYYDKKIINRDEIQY